MKLSEEIRSHAEIYYEYDWSDEVAKLEAKLLAVECSECEKTLLDCECE